MISINHHLGLKYYSSMEVLYKLQNLFHKQRKSVRYGIPFIIFVVGGSFGLKEFTQLRYQFRKKQPVDPDVAESYGIQIKNPGEVTLETEYEKIKKLDIDNWENIRGPRPWEDKVT